MMKTRTMGTLSMVAAVVFVACQACAAEEHVIDLDDTINMDRAAAVEWFNTMASGMFTVRGKLATRDSPRGSFGVLSACEAPTFADLMPRGWQSLDSDQLDDAFRKILGSGRLGWMLEVDDYLNGDIETQIHEAKLIDACSLYEVARSTTPIEITSTDIIGRVSILDAQLDP
jgi:hypothetical protein